MDTPTVIPSFEGRIKEDGTITLTFNQSFKADGMTRGDLEKEIRARYVPDYFKQMTVTVKQQESTRWYYLNGEVRSPARQIYNSRITVLKAIASSGGFTDFANKKKVKLTRVDGRTQIVNCPKALDNPSLDPSGPGDAGYGYCAFGRVVSGMEVVDKIAKVKTEWRRGMGDIPQFPVRLKEAVLLPPQ
jgi:protein involved in polysaccharide export with SLBB domain